MKRITPFSKATFVCFPPTPIGSCVSLVAASICSPQKARIEELADSTTRRSRYALAWTNHGKRFAVHFENAMLGHMEEQSSRRAILYVCNVFCARGACINCQPTLTMRISFQTFTSPIYPPIYHSHIQLPLFPPRSSVPSLRHTLHQQSSSRYKANTRRNYPFRFFASFHSCSIGACR